MIFYFSNTRQEFLSREMNWTYISDFREFVSKANLERLSPKNSYIFLVGNSTKELKQLSNFDTNTIWVYLYADEVYNLRLNHLISKKRCVVGIIHPYFNENEKTGVLYLKQVLRLIGSLINWKSSKRIELSRLGIAGLVMLIREELCKWNYKIRNKEVILGVLGYTNIFAFGFIDRYQLSDTSQSLLDSRNLDFNQKKSISPSVFFVGQKGNAHRQHFIKETRNFISKISSCLHYSIEVRLRHGFGGTIGANGASIGSAKEFIALAEQAWFGLCPPGNYAGQTFRLCELLVMDVLPIEPNFVLASPGYRTWELFADTIQESDSSRLQAVFTLSRSEREILSLRLKENYRQKINWISSYLA